VKHLDRMKLIDSDGDGDEQSTQRTGVVDGGEQPTQRTGVVDGEAYNSRPTKVKHRKKNNREQAQAQVLATVSSVEAKQIEGGEKEEPVTEQIITTTPVNGNNTNIEGQVKVQPSSKNDANAACDLVTCSFEDGTLCRYVSSKEEVPFGSRQYLRVRREKHNESSSSSNIVHRAWHNWIGRFRNRLTGIARAQVFGEDNQRFAAAYVRSKQRATLTARVLFDNEQTVRFRSWEATRGVTLSMCCDHNCLWKTEIGVKRGSRYWIDREVTCPAGTQKIMFVCENFGKHQGACGLDNIHLTNGICPLLLPAKGVVDGGGGDGNRKRRI